MPSGDIADFQTITQDTLNLVLANDLSGAKTRIADLEYEWDNSTSRLKLINQSKWSEIDSAIDQALKQLRAVKQNAASCKSSLEALLAVLN